MPQITGYLSLDEVKARKLPHHPSADGINNMTDINTRICLNMAHSLDAVAARMRDDSYMRKLLKEQATKYRVDATSE